MPNSFWKDRSVAAAEPEGAGGATAENVAGAVRPERASAPGRPSGRSAGVASGAHEDPAALRERYIEDGRTVARRLAEYSGVLAVWLSGPFEPPRTDPGSDLHVAVLVRGGDHAYYHHVLPPFSGTGRRLEIAFFPLETLRGIFDRGVYGSWSEVYDLHKLSDMEILFDRDGTLGGMRERLKILRPSPLFVGVQIDRLRSALDILPELLDNERHTQGILVARDAVMEALKLALVAGKHVLFSKPSHLHPLCAGNLDAAMKDRFECIHGCDAAGAEEAARTVEAADTFIKNIFEGQVW